MKRFALIASSVLATGALVASAGAAAPDTGKRSALDAYCSPTGDYCLKITNPEGAVVKLQIKSLAFSGAYTLCVRGPDAKNCRNYSLSHQGNGYADSVGLLSQFGYQGPGIYRVTWKIGGKALKKTLSFSYPG
ncbi:MAG: hypothetical protein QOI10_822 [Solirubrobacterales bacterium]|jgi:hypothetical protein|nr:hypothetical protein [Solirubrobacterales bacterium]